MGVVVARGWAPLRSPLPPGGGGRNSLEACRPRGGVRQIRRTLTPTFSPRGGGGRSLVVRTWGPQAARSQITPSPTLPPQGGGEIGRASCRERVCQYV